VVGVEAAVVEAAAVVVEAAGEGPALL